MSLDSFAEILGPLFMGFGHRAGGRRPQEKDMPSLDDIDDYVVEDDPVKKKKPKTWLTPCKPSEARLTICQITDVYTLDNFAHLKTLLSTIREAQQSTSTTNRVISMLTGDFLSPYLLSSIDRGAGMMQALKHTPIDYLTWGNHEADIDHRTVCRHVKNFPGTWINTNMQSHEAMEYQVPYEIITVTSPDGRNTRKIGLVAVLSNDPKLYSHFKPPGAFGGAKIECPWETLKKYKRILEEEHGCDLVVPLEHLYMPENARTCKDFDFPLILSGHDHHRVDEIIDGTRLIKPGMDGVYASVLEICWEDCNHASSMPKIRSTFVKTSDYDADPVLRRLTDRAYDVLLPLQNTELAGVPSNFEPLSSKNARGSLTTMGRLVCSMLKSSLEQSREKGESRVDAVILMGGNIRANEDYPIGSFVSLETLEAEIKSDEVIGVVPILGSVLAEGIEATHAGDPIPGWMQYDDGIREETVDPETNDGRPTKVTLVAGKPIDPHRVYRVATKIKDLTNGQSPPLTAHFKAYPELLPAKGSYINIQTELMGFFARNLFRKLWEATGHRIPDPEDILEEVSHPAPSVEEMEAQLRHDVLDQDNDGIVSVEDIHLCLRDFLGLSVHDDEMTLAEYIHSYADVTGDGQVTLSDLEIFCTGQLPRETKPIEKWSEAFPDPVAEETETQEEPAPGMKRVETTQTELMSDTAENPSDL